MEIGTGNAMRQEYGLFSHPANRDDSKYRITRTRLIQVKGACPGAAGGSRAAFPNGSIGKFIHSPIYRYDEPPCDE
ncbi:hypothetical protein [Burkholderia pyrrocinia]|uniref:hypothetical protein n=1 Tax=Burkholderia pyrrocinia TaxID=60550 RepID=UPI002AB11A7A|nr:hypothetical protein [Burkholderia pyrrocinia]